MLTCPRQKIVIQAFIANWLRELRPPHTHLHLQQKVQLILNLWSKLEHLGRSYTTIKHMYVAHTTWSNTLKLLYAWTNLCYFHILEGAIFPATKRTTKLKQHWKILKLHCLSTNMNVFHTLPSPLSLPTPPSLLSHTGLKTTLSSHSPTGQSANVHCQGLISNA